MTDHWWDGKFTKVGDNLLQYYKSDWGLPAADIELEQWKVYCDIQSSRPLAFILFHDTIEKIEQYIMKECYNESQLSDFWRSTAKILDYSLEFVKNFPFDNERRITNCLKLLSKISQTIALERLGLMPSNILNDIPSVIGDKKNRKTVEELTCAQIKHNANTWLNNQFVGSKKSEKIEFVKMVINQIGQRLEIFLNNYQVIFKK